MPLMLACLLGNVILCSSAKAMIPSSSGSPYQQVVARNIFGLTPPQVVPPESPRQAMPRVWLTGLTTIFGDARVLLKVEFPATPPEPAREQSYILAEGQREGPVEILAVDEKAGSTKLSLCGVKLVLTLEKDGPKLPNTSPPAPPPAAPPEPVEPR